MVIFSFIVMVLVGVPVACVDSSLRVGIENLDKDTSLGHIYLPMALEVNGNWAIRSDIIGDEFVDLLLSHGEGVSGVTTITEVSFRDSHILVKWNRSGRGGRSGRCRRIIWLPLMIEESKLNIGVKSAVGILAK